MIKRLFRSSFFLFLCLAIVPSQTLHAKGHTDLSARVTETDREIGGAITQGILMFDSGCLEQYFFNVGCVQLYKHNLEMLSLVSKNMAARFNIKSPLSEYIENFQDRIEDCREMVEAVSTHTDRPSVRYNAECAKGAADDLRKTIFKYSFSKK